MMLGENSSSGNELEFADRYARFSDAEQKLISLMVLFSAPLLLVEVIHLCRDVAEHRDDQSLASFSIDGDLLKNWVKQGFLRALGPLYEVCPIWQTQLLDHQLSIASKQSWINSIESVFSYEQADELTAEQWFKSVDLDCSRLNSSARNRIDIGVCVQQRLDRSISVSLLLDDSQRLQSALQYSPQGDLLTNQAQSQRFKRYLQHWRAQFPLQRLAEFSKSLQAMIIHLYLGPYGDLLDMDEEMLAYIQQFMIKARYERQQLLPRYLQYLLMMGKLDAIDVWLDIEGANAAALHTAWKAFLLNKSHETLAIIIAHQRVLSKQKNPQFYIGDLMGVFYCLALMQRLPEQPELQDKFTYQIQRAVVMISQQQDPFAMVQLYLHEIYRLYNQHIDSAQKEKASAQMLLTIERWLLENQQHPAWPIQFLVRCLHACWLDKPLSVNLTKTLVSLFIQVDLRGSSWLAGQLAFAIDVLLLQPQPIQMAMQSADKAITDKIIPENAIPESVLTENEKGTGSVEAFYEVASEIKFRVQALIQQMQHQNIWPLILLLPAKTFNQGALPALEKWMQTYAFLPNSIQESRIIWVLGDDSKTQRSARSLMLREQKRVRVGWSRGRLLQLKSVMEELPLWESLSLKDQQILKKTARQNLHYQHVDYELDFDRAIVQLVGQGNVYHEKDFEQPIKLVAKKPQLIVRDEIVLATNGDATKQIRIVMEPHPRQRLLAGESVMVMPESADCYRVVEFQLEHWRVADLVGKEGLLVPFESRQQTLKNINAPPALFNLQSEIADDDDLLAEKMEADSRLHLLLTPASEGLSVSVFVRPFGAFGPEFMPGQGAASLLIEVDGRRFKTWRDIVAERAELVRLCHAAPTALDFNQSPWCEVVGLEQAYEMLLYFQQLGPSLQLHWPKGKSVRLLPEVSQQQLNLTLSATQLSTTDTTSSSAKQNWFELTGVLKINESSIYTLPQLAAFMAKSASGRFIQLDDHSVLVLTEKLKRKLEQWRDYTNNGRFHLVASHAIEEIIDDMPVVRGAHWQQQIERFAQAQHLEPEVPETLLTQLRDYQKEGFKWLVRLAYAGMGACLADDMGLGKTIQALALLLTRAEDGPALIVAPKSVCINWISEIQRFAPSLKVFNFDQNVSLKKMAAFDLVVCSYGLLQSNVEQFVAVQWHTLVADEAQAIKNRQTKRTQAVVSLVANFKLAITGTPIENHLGDLWSLFRFINPGLLGSLEAFNQRFVLPMEPHLQVQTQTHLHDLIKPFLLRRLKHDVTAELPSRTEITIDVTLSEPEQALYEALRRQAVNTISSSSGSVGQKRLRILAELMRLRRACCHPSMVLPQSGISSSKLQMLLTLVDGLLQNQHKALVFSQFVDHLQLIKAELDNRGIAYQYLDGSTSTAKRQMAVNQFQAGHGDLFLISLKAGGVGLNLTAADYVIHMDPWWNPAVEDQASDRAHRIGQLRPVTIYRLVAVDTIEQKIMALHQRKRDLAASLLAGTDKPVRLSLEEMQRLLDR